MKNRQKNEMKILTIGIIPNKDNFRFIGIDSKSGEHFCIVRKGDDGLHYMESNTILFKDLIGWIPDPDAKMRRDGKIQRRSA